MPKLCNRREAHRQRNILAKIAGVNLPFLSVARHVYESNPMDSSKESIRRLAAHIPSG